MDMVEPNWKRRNIFKNTKDFFEQKAVAIGRVRVGKYPQESDDWRFIALEPVSEYPYLGATHVYYAVEGRL